MTRWPGTRGCLRTARLLAVLTLLLLPTASLRISETVHAAVACAGDEQLMLAPAEPRPGDLLFLATVSTVPHEFAFILGPAGPVEATRQAVGDRFVWQGTVLLDRPGEYAFSFVLIENGVPIAACTSASIVVGLGAAPSEPLPTTPPTGTTPPTDTPRPTSTPRPAVSRSENENESDDGSEHEPTPTRTPRPSDTPRPTNTPRPTETPRPPTNTPVPPTPVVPPSIRGLSPESAVRGRTLTIRGEGFGESRSDVDGRVTIEGAPASVTSWSSTEIVVQVSGSTPVGNDKTLVITVNGKTATRSIRVND